MEEVSPAQRGGVHHAVSGRDNRLGLEPPGHHKSLTMAADQERQGVGECFSHIGQELCIAGRVTCVRGSEDPKPPMTYES